MVLQLKNLRIRNGKRLLHIRVATMTPHLKILPKEMMLPLCIIRATRWQKAEKLMKR